MCVYVYIVSFVWVDMCAYTHACISVCLSVSVWYMHVDVFMDGCMCVLKHAKAWDWCQLSSSMTFYLCFWDQVFSEPRTHWLGGDQTTNKLYGSSCLCGCRIPDSCGHTQLLGGFWGIQTQAFMLSTWRTLSFELPPIPAIVLNASTTRTAWTI